MSLGELPSFLEFAKTCGSTRKAVQHSIEWGNEYTVAYAWKEANQRQMYHLQKWWKSANVSMQLILTFKMGRIV